MPFEGQFFNDLRFLYFSIHRKALNALIWSTVCSFGISSNLLFCLTTCFSQQKICILAPPSSLQTVLQSSLRDCLLGCSPGFSGGSDSKESTMPELVVRFLGWEDPLEECMQPTPVFFPGESPWTEDYSPWSCKELDITEQLSKALLDYSLQLGLWIKFNSQFLCCAFYY